MTPFPGVEIIVRLLFIHLMNNTLNTDLPAKIGPVEEHGPFRVFIYLQALATSVIGEKDEAAIIKILKKKRILPPRPLITLQHCSFPALFVQPRCTIMQTDQSDYLKPCFH